MIRLLGTLNGLGIGSGICEMQRQFMLLFLDPGMTDLLIKFFCSQGAARGVLILSHISRPYPNQSVACSTDIIVHYPEVPVTRRCHSRHIQKN